MSAWHPWGRNPRAPDPLVPDVCTIDLWQVESGKVSQSFVGHDLMNAVLEFSPDGKRLAAVTFDRDHALSGALVIWDIATGAKLLRRTFDDHLLRIQFSKDGSRLLTWSGDATPTLPGDTKLQSKGYRICLWDVAQLLKSE